MTLHGKGWFIWQIPRCENGQLAAIAETAHAAGLTHLLIKIAERTYAFGYDKDGRDLVAPVVSALRARGMGVWGWHYVYGDDPKREAEAAIKRVTQLGLDGYVIDAEAEYKRPGKASAARTFMQTLRAGLPNTPIALSSYRYPSLHPQLPWAAFLEKCDWVMPQVYWEQMHNPDQQLARCVAEFANVALVGHARPLAPTGAAYGAGQWQATPDDITKFLNKALALKLPAVNFYSWDYARAPGHTALWDAVKNFAWPTTQTPPDIAQRFIDALNASDLAALVRLYHLNAGHVTARRTIIGPEDLSKWYLDLLKNKLAGAKFTLLETSGKGNARRIKWAATGPAPAGKVADGDDTLGLREGLIQYHYFDNVRLA